MNKSLQISPIILVTLLTTANISANPRDNGIYVGIDAKLINFGGDSYNETTTKNKTITYKDSESTPVTVKIGYQHLKKNKIEFYGRQNKIKTGSGKISTDTYGINYEFGIASLSPSNKKVLPYASIGYGIGNAKSNSNQLKLKSTVADEFEVGLGIHYQINKHLDSTIGFKHRAIFFEPNNLLLNADTATNTVEAGINYHF